MSAASISSLSTRLGAVALLALAVGCGDDGGGAADGGRDQAVDEPTWDRGGDAQVSPDRLSTDARADAEVDASPGFCPDMGGPDPGINYTCEQVCAAMDSCSGGADDCRQACGMVIDSFRSAIVNEIAACILDDPCAGDRPEVCMGQALAAHQGDPRERRDTECQALTERIRACGHTPPAELCLVLPVFLRDIAWVAVSSCQAADDCDAMFGCMTVVNRCFFPGPSGGAN